MKKIFMAAAGAMVTGALLFMGIAPASATSEAPVTTPQVISDNFTAQSFRVQAYVDDSSGAVSNLTYELEGSGWDIVTAALGEPVTFDGLTANTGYRLTVVAYGEDGSSASNSLVINTLPLAPNQPQLNVSDITWNSATVSVASGEDSSPVNSFELTVTGSDFSRTFNSYEATAFSVTELSPDSDYTVNLTVTGPGGSASNFTSFRTVLEPPATPSIILAGEIQATSALLSISAGAGGGPVDGFIVNLYNGDVLEQYKNVPADATSVLFESLTPDTNYLAELIAVGAGGTASSTGGFYTKALPVVPVDPTPTDPEPVDPEEPSTGGEETPAVVSDPVAPDQNGLNADNSGGLTINFSGDAGSQITVNGLSGSGEVRGWLFSSPTYLGQVTINGGSATFTVPSSVPAGSHRIAITDLNNNLLGWAYVTVKGASPVVTASLAEAGSSVPYGALALAGGALLGGLALVFMRRRTSVS